MEKNSVFYKKVGILILPIALQNLINVGISSIDVIMLGRVGEKVLSGASLGSQINFIMSLLLFGIMSGASVLIAQYWGKKNIEAIQKVFGMAMKIATCVGIVFDIWISRISGDGYQRCGHWYGGGESRGTFDCGDL